MHFTLLSIEIREVDEEICKRFKCLQLIFCYSTFSGAATSASNIHGSRRANRVFRPPPQFGITPLPNTPSSGNVKPFPRTPGLVAPSRSFNILKESAKSFAPNTFNFQVIFCCFWILLHVIFLT